MESTAIAPVRGVANNPEFKKKKYFVYHPVSTTKVVKYHCSFQEAIEKAAAGQMLIIQNDKRRASGKKA